MITVTFQSSDDRVKQAILERKVRIQEAMVKTMDRLMLELQRKVEEKLSGQVLQPRSGQLLGSVHKEETKWISGKLMGRVTAGGGLASVYPIVQEKGGKRTYDIYPVEKLALAFFPANSLGATSLRLQGNRLRYKLGTRRGSLRPAKYGEFANLGGIVVKHVVHPPLIARPFMSTAMAEMREQIIERLRASLYQELS